MFPHQKNLSIKFKFNKKTTTLNFSQFHKNKTEQPITVDWGTFTIEKCQYDLHDFFQICCHRHFQLLTSKAQIWCNLQQSCTTVFQHTTMPNTNAMLRRHYNKDETISTVRKCSTSSLQLQCCLSINMNEDGACSCVKRAIDVTIWQC